MFGLGFTEIVLILVVALLVLGPEKIPEAARALGRATAYFRRTLDEVKHDLSVADLAEMRERSLKIFEGCPEDTARLLTGDSSSEEGPSSEEKQQSASEEREQGELPDEERSPEATVDGSKAES